MKHVKLEIVYNEDYGQFGFGFVPLRYKNWKTYLPSFSLGHDLIEHTLDESGEVYQELRALGAYLFTSDFGKFTFLKKYDVFLSDLENTLTDQNERVLDLPNSPIVKLTKRENERFDGFVKSIRRGYIEKETLEFWDNNKDKIISWLKYGFHLAKRRYNGDYGTAWYMRTKLDNLSDNNEIFKQKVGETVTLSYDFDTTAVYITDKYGERYFAR